MRFFFSCSVGRLTAAILLLVDFLPFYGVASEMQNEIKRKQAEDRGEEGENVICGR